MFMFISDSVSDGYPPVSYKAHSFMMQEFTASSIEGTGACTMWYWYSSAS
jgi:hypothetical protein